MTRRSTRAALLGVAAMSFLSVPGCRSGEPRPTPIADAGDYFRRRSMRPVEEPYPVYRPTYGKPENEGGPALNGYAGFNYPPLFGGRRRATATPATPPRLDVGTAEPLE